MSECQADGKSSCDMMRQPTMMNMASGMPVNIQQPMVNFGYGNNMKFYEANMRNSTVG